MSTLGKTRALRAVAAAAIITAGLGAMTITAAPADARVFVSLGVPGAYYYGYPGFYVAGVFGPHPHPYYWHRAYVYHHPFDRDRDGWR
jgi:hypothetical protein